jgi:hypothetical protein
MINDAKHTDHHDLSIVPAQPGIQQARTVQSLLFDSGYGFRLERSEQFAGRGLPADTFYF